MKKKAFCISFDEMYEAVTKNNENYDTLFFYAVKSTGIYCRPSCKSKEPKVENIEFFKTAIEAKTAGYRPCKRCRSDLLEYKPMKEIAKKMKNMINDMYHEVSELNTQMDKFGMSRKRMTEIFKEEYGVTPSVYANNLRYEEAKKMLEQTDNKVIDISYLIGFSSLSAFYKFFKERALISPAAFRKGLRNEKLCNI